MSRLYDPSYYAQPTMPMPGENHDSLSPVASRARPSYGRAQSPSASDDDYGASHRISAHLSDTELEEDPNAALTSQTLNADGTPKRPMNAFMIFARRRRPQVSAENQSMRTGEISKILSREWNAMNMADKQFYLDQAKILKDNFNTKYPDYVYRRRPNNTRKKRRTDGGRTTDGAETGDDLSGGAEMEASPLGSEAYLDPGFDYPQMSATPAPSVHPQFMMSSRSSHQPYSSSIEVPRRQSESHAHYDRHGMGQSPVESSRISRTMPSTSHYQPQIHESYYPQQSVAHSWVGGGETGRATPSHAEQPGWLPNKYDRPYAGVSGEKGKASQSYPTAQPTQQYPSGMSSWKNPGPAGSHSAPNQTSVSPDYAFPTLNSPFYPNQSPLSGSYSSSASSNYSGGSRQPSNGPQSDPYYDSRGYASSTSMNSLSSYNSDPNRNPQMYSPSHLPSSGSSRSTHMQSPSHPPKKYAQGPVIGEYWSPGDHPSGR